MKARFENHQPRLAKGSSLDPNNTQSNPVLAVPSNACGIHADDKHQETAKGCERHHGTQKTESGKQPTSSRCEQNGYKQHWSCELGHWEIHFGESETWVNLGVKNLGAWPMKLANHRAFFAGNMMFLGGLLDLSLGWWLLATGSLNLLTYAQCSVLIFFHRASISLSRVHKKSTQSLSFRESNGGFTSIGFSASCRHASLTLCRSSAMDCAGRSWQ